MNEVEFIDKSLLDEEPVTEEVTGSFSDTEVIGIELNVKETPIQQVRNTTMKVESENETNIKDYHDKSACILLGVGILIAGLVFVISYKLKKGR